MLKAEIQLVTDPCLINTEISIGDLDEVGEPWLQIEKELFWKKKSHKGLEASVEETFIQVSDPLT